MKKQREAKVGKLQKKGRESECVCERERETDRQTDRGG